MKIPLDFYLHTPAGRAVAHFNPDTEAGHISLEDQREFLACTIRLCDPRHKHLMVGGYAVLHPKDKDDFVHAAKLAFGRAVKNLLAVMPKEEEKKRVFDKMKFPVIGIDVSGFGDDTLIASVSYAEEAAKGLAEAWAEAQAEAMRRATIGLIPVSTIEKDALATYAKSIPDISKMMQQPAIWRAHYTPAKATQKAPAKIATKTKSGIEADLWAQFVKQMKKQGIF